MHTIRSFALSALVAIAAFFSISPASARAIGGFSIDTTGPVTPSPPNNPWGGVILCTAHLRKYDLDQGRWLYHLASGYNFATCKSNAQPYLVQGYQHNPNPNFGFCQCHEGFNGMMVSSPTGTGPITVNNLSQEQVQVYDEGLLQLRQKYRFDEFVQEHEALLQAIESMPAGDR